MWLSVDLSQWRQYVCRNRLIALCLEKGGREGGGREGRREGGGRGARRRERGREGEQGGREGEERREAEVVVHVHVHLAYQQDRPCMYMYVSLMYNLMYHSQFSRLGTLYMPELC